MEDVHVHMHVKTPTREGICTSQWIGSHVVDVDGSAVGGSCYMYIPTEFERHVWLKILAVHSMNL